MRKASVSIRTIIAVVGLTLAAASLAVAQQPAGAPAARTAAQAYKNIQVLKDIPKLEDAAAQPLSFEFRVLSKAGLTHNSGLTTQNRIWVLTRTKFSLEPGYESTTLR